MSERPSVRPSLNAVLLAFVAFSLGQAVLLSNGNLHPDAIKWVTAALITAIVAMVVPKWPKVLEDNTHLLFPAALTVMLGVELVQCLTHMPGIYLRLGGPEPLFTLFASFGVMGLLAGLSLRDDRLGGWAFAGVLVTFALVGRWLLKTSPDPFIDVFVFQRDATTALLNGENPYALRYPDIYGNSPFYGEGLSVGGRLLFGFPYPPLSLYLVMPFQKLLGDYRYAQLFAMVGVAGLLAWAKPGPQGRALGALWLFMPRMLFVLEQGWTEPLVVFALALVVFVVTREVGQKRGQFLAILGVTLGALLVLKQYLVFALPLIWLLPQVRTALMGFKARRPDFTKLVGFALVPGVLSLPLALWSWKDFWFDVVALQVYQPFRVEALSYLAWWAQQHGGDKPPTVLAFVAALLALGLSLWKAPRTASGFALGVGLTMLCFIAFNKQAFCNYYAMVLGAFACAAALAFTPEAAPSES